ncbi:hypothetical protein PS708_02541 [Pseudomonas fluorescens]|nr:hypothetical protein PS708_02541 [Pseudomonas fluorescens]
MVPLKLAMAHQATCDNQRYWHFLQRHGIVDVVEIIAHRAGQPQAAISLLRKVEPGGVHRRSTRPSQRLAVTAANGGRQYAAQR